MSALIISNINVRDDADGRYCLNDLHRAAGRVKKERPGYFLARPETQALIVEIESDGLTAGRPAVVTKDGRGGGTFASDDLVYAYAMWISPKFCLRVIRAYKVQTGQELRQTVGLMHQRLALETRDASSKVKATFGARLMLDRRRELPTIRAERDLLALQMEPSLFHAEEAFARPQGQGATQ